MSKRKENQFMKKFAFLNSLDDCDDYISWSSSDNENAYNNVRGNSTSQEKRKCNIKKVNKDLSSHVAVDLPSVKKDVIPKTSPILISKYHKQGTRTKLSPILTCKGQENKKKSISVPLVKDQLTLPSNVKKRLFLDISNQMNGKKYKTSECYNKKLDIIDHKIKESKAHNNSIPKLKFETVSQSQKDGISLSGKDPSDIDMLETKVVNLVEDQSPSASKVKKKFITNQINGKKNKTSQCYNKKLDIIDHKVKEIKAHNVSIPKLKFETVSLSRKDGISLSGKDPSDIDMLEKKVVNLIEDQSPSASKVKKKFISNQINGKKNKTSQCYNKKLDIIDHKIKESKAHNNSIPKLKFETVSLSRKDGISLNSEDSSNIDTLETKVVNLVKDQSPSASKIKKKNISNQMNGKKKKTSQFYNKKHDIIDHEVKELKAGNISVPKLKLETVSPSRKDGISPYVKDPSDLDLLRTNLKEIVNNKPKIQSDLLNKEQSHFVNNLSSNSGTEQSISECETSRNTSKSSDDPKISSSLTPKYILPHLKMLSECENCETCAILNKKQRIKHKKGGLAHRLAALVKTQTIDVRFWEHEKYLTKVTKHIFPTCKHIVLRIQKLHFKYGCYLIEAKDANDQEYKIIINMCNVNSECIFNTDYIFKLYVPYKVLDVDNNCKLVFNVSKFECVPMIQCEPSETVI